MASTLHRLSFTAIRYSHRTCLRRKHALRPSLRRELHQTPVARARRDAGAPQPPVGAQKEAFQFNLKDLSPEEREVYKSLSPKEQEEAREEARIMHEHYSNPEFVSEMNSAVSLAANEILDQFPRIEPEPPKRMEGYMAMGENEPQDIGDDPEFEGDDITSLAHGELEQHREMREYARLAVWEMPLLYKLRKPFTPPTTSQPLRFRSTTYLGESHPAAKKIVLEFTTSDIATAASLTPAQRTKLIKLVGVRYNPDTDTVKMSCESFETPAQNKRYLSDLVDKLVEEAKDERDMLEDVPVDFRHHKRKKVYKFPEEWKLDAKRRQELVEQREEQQRIEEGMEAARMVVDGRRVVDEAVKVPVGRVQGALPFEQARILERAARSPRAR